MEKLVKLLVRYEKQRKKSDILDHIDREGYGLKYTTFIWKYEKIYLLISKKYGFINRLYKNNKIDRTKIEEYGYYGTEWYCPEDECILMQLSVSDTPLQDLLSILK